MMIANLTGIKEIDNNYVIRIKGLDDTNIGCIVGNDIQSKDVINIGRIIQSLGGSLNHIIIKNHYYKMRTHNGMV
jgi:hypothetical protein